MVDIELLMSSLAKVGLADAAGSIVVIKLERTPWQQMYLM